MFDGVDELLEIDGFNDVGVDAKFVAFDEVLLFAGGSKHDDGDGLEAVIGLDLAQHLHAVHLGHFEVEKDDGGISFRPGAVAAATIEVIKRFGSVPGRHDFIGKIRFFKGRQRQLSILRIVFDEKYAFQFVHSFVAVTLEVRNKR